MPSKKFFSVKEASKIIGVSTNTVYKYLDDGSLKGKRMGGRGRFKIPFSELAPYFSKTIPNEVTEVVTDEVSENEVPNNKSSFFGSILETVSIGLSALLILWVFGSVTLGTEPAPMKNVGDAVLSYSGRTFSGFGNLVSQLMPAKKTENPEVAGANVSVPTTPPTEAVPEQKTADLNYKLKDTERLIYELYVNAQSLAADAQKLLGKSRTLTAAELNDQLVGMSQLLGSSSGTVDESTIYAQVGRLTDSWNFPALDPLERSLDQVSSSLDRLSQKSLGAFTKPEVKDLNDLVAQTDLLQRLVGTITDTSAEPTVFGNLRKADAQVAATQAPAATPAIQVAPIVEATPTPQVAIATSQAAPIELTPALSPQMAAVSTQIPIPTPVPEPTSVPQVAGVATQAILATPTPTSAPIALSISVSYKSIIAGAANVITPDVQRIIGAVISILAVGALLIYLLILSRNVLLRIIRGFIRGFYRVVVAIVMFPVKVVRKVWALVTSVVSFIISVVTSVKKTLVSIGKFIFSIPGRILVFVVSIVVSIKKAIVHTIKVIAAFIVSIANGFYRLVVSVVASIKRAVISVIRAVITLISNIISAVKNFFVSLALGIKRLFVSIFHSIKRFVVNIIHTVAMFVSNTISAIKTLFVSIMSAIKRAVLSVKNGILTILSSIKVFFLKMAGLIKKLVVSVITGIFRGADSTERALTRFVKGTESLITNMAVSIKLGMIRTLNAIKNLFLNIVSSIAKFIVTITGAIVRFIVSTILAIKNFFVRVINSIITFIEKIILAVTKVITFIVTGIINILVTIVTFFLKTISLVTRALALVMGGLYKILVVVTERTDSTLGSIHFEPSQSRGSHIRYRKASIFILVVILSAVVSAVFAITVLAQIEKGPTTSLRVEETSVNDITKKPSLDLPKEEKIVVQETGTGWLRVRSIPGGSEIGRVYPGERYILLDQKDGWVLIALPAGQKGWVSSKYISFE